jgi:excinuclease UvrABC ATPase subunit
VGGSRSRVGTYTDIAALLRLLFSRVGQPHAGSAFAFSFNTPQGMCPECEGIGKMVQLDLDKFLDKSKSLNEQFVTLQTCPLCKGARVNQAALSSEINGRNIAEMSDLEATELIEVLFRFSDPVAAWPRDSSSGAAFD